MIRRKKSFAAVLMLGFLSVMAASTADAAQSAEDFYKGKRVDFYIGYKPGGGFDIWGRLLIAHMARHIPGKPTIIVRNMPGASSLTMTRFLVEKGDKTGLNFGILNPSIISRSVTDPKKVDVDMTKLTWIGSLSSDVKMCYAWAATGIKTPDDVRKRATKFGGVSARGGSYNATQMFKAAVGPNVQLVLGYPSNTDIFLAIERGELDAHCTGYDVFPVHRPEWLAEKKINILAQFAVKRNWRMPDVPTIFETKLPKDLGPAIEFIVRLDEFTRPIFAPPGIPADRIAALRKAFIATTKDSAFLADAEKQKLKVDVKTHDEIEALVQKIISVPRPIAKKARSILKRKKK